MSIHRMSAGAACAVSLFASLGGSFAGTPVTEVAPAPAPAESAFQGNVHIGGHSDYIFRGADMGDGMAEGGVDASLKLGQGFTLSGGLWYASIENSALGNFPFATVPDHYSELDLYGQVSKDFGWLTASVGYIWYHYADTELTTPAGSTKLIDDSQEIFFGVSREIAWGIQGSLTYFWDIETDNGGYTELALSKSLEICDKTSLDLAVKTGYLIEEGGFSYIQPMATLNYKVTDTVTISPYLAYSVELDELDTVAGPSGNRFYGGVKLAVSF